MKIVILGNYPTYPFSNILGVPYVARKISTWLIYLCKYLRSYPGVELHVVTEDEFLSADTDFLHDGIHFHFLKCPKKYRAATLFIGDVYRLTKMVKKINPDIINAHHTDEFALAAIYSGYPYVISVHGILSRFVPQDNWFSRERIVAKIEKHILKHATHLIATSPFVYEAVGNLTSAKFYDVENCLETIYFEQTKDYSIDNNLVFIGSVIRDKGVHFLLNAVDILKNEFRDVKLRILGTFSSHQKTYTEELLEYIRSNKLENHISFDGFVSGDQKISILNNATMLVHPSRLETFCLSVAEAMAIGTPVVASRVGGLPYTIGGEDNAILVEYGSVDGLVEGISKLLRNPVLRKELGEKGKKQAQARFHPSVIIPQIVNVFNDVIHDKKGHEQN